VADADAAGAADEDEDEDGEDGEEPEDDFNAAWEILDLARALFELQSESDELAKLKLADTYVALGDVSLETGVSIAFFFFFWHYLTVFAEKFDQAISDYEAGLALKTALLPTSSRQLAEVHYKLALVLDMSPGRLKDAIAHVDNALASTKARLDELRVALANGPPAEVPAPAPAPAAASDTKGKGKVAAPVLDKNTVASLSKAQVEAEIKEMEGLSGDLQLKVSFTLPPAVPRLGPTFS
jgi:HAT1-interacting factor 1